MPRKKVTCEEINRELADFPSVYKLEIAFTMVFTPNVRTTDRKLTLCGSHHKQMLFNLKSRLDLMYKEDLKLFLHMRGAIMENELGKFLLNNVNITVTSVGQV